MVIALANWLNGSFTLCLFKTMYKIYNVTDEDRVECIKKILRLDHLNQDEYEHVEKLI